MIHSNQRHHVVTFIFFESVLRAKVDALSRFLIDSMILALSPDVGVLPAVQIKNNEFLKALND